MRNTTARYSISPYSFSIKVFNFESRIPQEKCSMEIPPIKIHDDQPQWPTYLALGGELGVSNQNFILIKKLLEHNFINLKIF